MDREEFEKSFWLMDHDGMLFIPHFDKPARECILYRYFGKVGDEDRGNFKCLYGRIVVTEKALLNDWLSVLKNEYNAVMEDLFKLALEEFNGDLSDIEPKFGSEYMVEANLENLVKAIEDYFKERERWMKRD